MTTQKFNEERTFGVEIEFAAAEPAAYPAQEASMYNVQKHFLSGIFSGLTITETTSVKYEAGQEYRDFTGNLILIMSVEVIA